MGIEDIGRRILAGMTDQPVSQAGEVKAPDASSFCVILQEGDGRGKMEWDKNTISREDLKIYFPGTLGGILEADTRKPVRFNDNGEMLLQNGKTYEVRTPPRKGTPPDGSPTHDSGEDDSMEEDDGLTSQQRLLQYLRFPEVPNNSNYTWSNLIEKALRTMGGQRTGQEITSFIEHNFRELISGKTKTWRNSVMGCLSSNARKRWVKEQTTVDGKRRYVWNLKEEKQKGARKPKPPPREPVRSAIEELYAEASADNDNTLAPASLLGSLSQGSVRVNSPFAARTLSNMMRRSPPQPPAQKKSKLFHEGDTSGDRNGNGSSSPIRAPLGSPASQPLEAPKSPRPAHDNTSQLPSPSKTPLFFLSNIALLPEEAMTVAL